MFKRRTPKHWTQSARDFFWPSMGIKRAIRYFYLRTVRLSDTPHRIAVGFANGAAISYTPFVGTHLIQALGLSYFTKGNYLATLIGTFWGNPWTFGLWFAISFHMGIKITEVFGIGQLAGLPDDITLAYLLDNPVKILLPFTIGGYTVAAIFWALAYFPLYFMIRSVQMARAQLSEERRAKRKALKQKKVKANDTGIRDGSGQHLSHA